MASTRISATSAAQSPAGHRTRSRLPRRRTEPSPRQAITSCFSSTTTAPPPKEPGFASCHDKEKTEVGGRARRILSLNLGAAKLDAAAERGGKTAFRIYN